MCGIGGGIAFSAKPLRDASQSLIVSLECRGPDDSGVFDSNRDFSEFSTRLIHTRLSIIDLSSAGHQPFISANGRYAISFNGEIYNYLELKSQLESLGVVFTSKTDTEVLLAAWEHWGEDALKRLEGMYAFAVWDEWDRNLTLVTDPFGIKPLYWFSSGETFLFSSTPDSIAKSGVANFSPNLQSAFKYIAFGQYDQGPETFFEGIFRLSSGSILRVSAQDGAIILRQSKWWNPTLAELNISLSEAVETFREIFFRNLNMQLRSDVKLSFALSGGLDSSSLVCSASTRNKNANFEVFSYCAEDSSISEERYSKIVADYCDLNLNQVRFLLADLDAEIEEMSMAQGEPFSTSRIFAQYRVFQQAAKKGNKVLLEGQGGDELLAGYDGFAESRILSLIEKKRFLELLQFICNWRRWPGRSYVSLLGKLFNQLFPSDKMSLKFLFFLRELALGENPQGLFRAKKLRQLNLSSSSLYRPRLREENRGRRLAESLLDALTNSYIPQLVRQGDRNAMHFSIENRVPFLSRELAEFTLQLPEEYLISNEGETKYILRLAMRGVIPEEIRTRRDKIGFEAPQEQLWQSQTLQTRALGEYETGKLLPFLKPVSVDKIKGASLKWRYLNLALWARQQFS